MAEEIQTPEPLFTLDMIEEAVKAIEKAAIKPVRGPDGELYYLFDEEGRPIE